MFISKNNIRYNNIPDEQQVNKSVINTIMYFFIYVILNLIK